MLKLSVNELTTFRWTLEEDLAHFAALGIDGIGVWRQKLTDCGVEHGTQLIHESGLQVSSLLWAGGFTGNEGCSHRDSIEDSIEALYAAAEMQANCLVVYTGGRGGHTRSHSRRLVRSALCDLASVAEDVEVTLTVEPMHIGCGTNWTFLHTLEETVELLDSINSPYLKMVFDTYHLGFEPGIAERIAENVDHIGLVHLGDAKRAPRGEQNRCAIGQGNLPIASLIRSLQQAGYDGFYELELLGEEIESRAYAQTINESLAAIHDMSSVTRLQSRNQPEPTGTNPQ